MPKTKNIIIFVSIGAVFILIYIFFLKPSPPPPTLVSTTPVTPSPTTTALEDANSSVAREFLSLLLSVKSIKLNDSIFSDQAFMSLHDSSITLIPDGNEGRPNPFAPLGTDNFATGPTTPPATPPA